MENYNYIHEELKGICPFLIKIGRAEVYSVPSSYFDKLSLDIFSRINLNKERAYFSGTAATYSVPENYFDTLSQIILKKVVAEEKKTDEVFEETETIAPLLNTISKNPVYSVPSGFF